VQVCPYWDCGSLSSTTGNTVTYTAPVATTLVATLQATSLADNTKSATATAIVTLPISVSVAPGWSSVAPGGVQRFVAPVTNDPSLSGVTWTLSQNGAPCSPACGTISPESTTGIALTTYMAPSTIPNALQVTITATSIANPIRMGSVTLAITSGGNNNSKLSGRYAFLMGAYEGVPGFNSGPTEIGSFFADGEGGISGTAVLYSTQPPIQVTGAYTIDSNGRGSLSLTSESGLLAGMPVPLDYHPAPNGNVGTGSIDTIAVPAGGIKKQDTTAFSTSKIVGGYAFGFSGVDCHHVDCGRFQDVGQFHADGAGNLTREGTTGGSYSVSDTGTGYGTLVLPYPSGGTAAYAFFVVTATELFFKSDPSDPTGPGTGYLIGQALRQQTPPNGFSNESLNAISVIRETGGLGPYTALLAPGVLVGLLNPDGAGNFTLTDNKNDGGTITSEALNGSYSVASDGAVTITGGKNPTIYLVGPNQGFVSDNVTFSLGFLQPQTATSVAGSYAYNTMIGAVPGKVESGMATLGANGDITLDINNGGDPSTFQTFTGMYTIGSDGKGTITITSPSAKTLQMYVVSPRKFVVIDSLDPGDVAPAVFEFSQ
jgi:hypothetical protein